MELIFLGTASATPTFDRNMTGLAVRRDGSWDLFDCGEGTQHRLLRTSLALSKLDRIFVSHLHGDHCFGLFGVLTSRSMDRAAGPLTVFGPIGIAEMITTVLRVSSSHLTYDLDIREVPDEGMRLASGDDDGWVVDAIPLDHRVTSFAWHHTEHDRPGVFDPEAARELGVVEGPDFGRLQHGEAIKSPDGTVVRPDMVLGPTRPGRSMVISGDDRDPARLLATSGPVDVLVHEATFTEDVVATLGSDRGHSTARRVAAASTAAGVRTLVLTHFSSRYASEDRRGRTIDEVRAEAEGAFSGALHLAADLTAFSFRPDGELVVLDAADAGIRPH